MSEATFIFYVLVCLCMGSAMSSLSWRLPRTLEHNWRKEAHDFLALDFNDPAPESFFKGRSICPNCGSTLTPRDLMPLLSYALNSGKCRHCKNSIPIRYPIIEAFSLVILLPLYFLTNDLTELGLLLLLISSLLLALIIDAEHQWIPDQCSVWVSMSAFILMYSQGQDPSINLLFALFAYFLIVSLRWLFLKVRKVEAIGLGDAKLLAALVFWLGPTALSPILLMASITGMGFHILTKKQMSERIPFGPFLIISALLIFYYKAYS
ncbi:prepilin peptidase [Rhodanobacter aciditrophus]|uniref:Prepilin leader peptidase/N-methyltransferase n=1 Tax=Rhodanobacter aciditrophus TaxID=1623218 RepID=A0ABW4B118_9GAMM